MKLNYFFAKSFALFLTASLANLLSAQTYCSPSYNSGCTNWRITQVTIPQVGFDNTFAAGTCISARDRTSVVINLTTATNYTLNVLTTNWIACGMAIDFNKDGDFDDAGETLFLPAYSGNQNETYTGNFMIPASVLAGSYRMRIWNRLANSGAGSPTPDSACSVYGYGTWTDYTVNIAQLATSEVTKSTARIYPNPVLDVLNIEDTKTVKSIEIYDLNGKLIKNESINNKKASVRLSDLIPGVYTAKIVSDKGNQTVKFIKK
ncbi:Por secretion system C-terminal sorting domain-containing protein [Chryseobacterium soldanellicola]|uniref:Por secretion system C-terminal sorting domain-containing protein n=1 Tax=Chryseobacterium soldanellicola TaxID=311333 RepID=A0A1H0YX57_9FLAO|nr:T9SS type A sorting domain-containing protein [Chryseobacterium soldanellicola]SDQ19755.1 Por secretion system C-terminal sorting domain-containing protein [Chryseobacterium soldanellicola]